jgi:hypothetical protein
MKVGEAIVGAHVNFPESEFEGTALTNRSPFCGLRAWPYNAANICVARARFITLGCDEKGHCMNYHDSFYTDPVPARLELWLRQVPFGTWSAAS